MSQGREKRPAGETGRPEISVAGDNSRIPQSTPNLRELITASPLGDPDLADFICNNPRALAVFSCGYSAAYELGFLDGHSSAQLDQEQQAENAARRFYALEGAEMHARKVAQGAAAMIEVNAYRRSPGSSYIPRKGDPRYSVVSA